MQYFFMILMLNTLLHQFIFLFVYCCPLRRRCKVDGLLLTGIWWLSDIGMVVCIQVRIVLQLVYNWLYTGTCLCYAVTIIYLSKSPTPMICWNMILIATSNTLILKIKLNVYFIIETKLLSLVLPVNLAMTRFLTN